MSIKINPIADSKNTCENGVQTPDEHMNTKAFDVRSDYTKNTHVIKFPLNEIPFDNSCLETIKLYAQYGCHIGNVNVQVHYSEGPESSAELIDNSIIKLNICNLKPFYAMINTIYKKDILIVFDDILRITNIFAGKQCGTIPQIMKTEFEHINLLDCAGSDVYFELGFCKKNLDPKHPHLKKYCVDSENYPWISPCDTYVQLTLERLFERRFCCKIKDIFKIEKQVSGLFEELVSKSIGNANVQKFVAQGSFDKADVQWVINIIKELNLTNEDKFEIAKHLFSD